MFPIVKITDDMLGKYYAQVDGGKFAYTLKLYTVHKKSCDSYRINAYILEANYLDILHERTGVSFTDEYELEIKGPTFEIPTEQFNFLSDITET